MPAMKILPVARRQSLTQRSMCRSLACRLPRRHSDCPFVISRSGHNIHERYSILLSQHPHLALSRRRYSRYLQSRIRPISLMAAHQPRPSLLSCSPIETGFTAGFGLTATRLLSTSTTPLNPGAPHCRSRSPSSISPNTLPVLCSMRDTSAK